MRIVTSIGPGRTERQQKCIATWIALGCDVTAVQSAGEAELLQPLYPSVTFVETSLVGDVFNRPKLVRIRALIDQAENENILILNSDIEVRSSSEEFISRWFSSSVKQLKIGLRWDENQTTKSLSLIRWGIDAFLITPKIKEDLNDIGMTMGCPAWDFWIPIHLYKQRYKIITYKDQSLIHENHERNWSDEDYRIGIDLIQKHYRMNERSAANWIRLITKRK